MRFVERTIRQAVAVGVVLAAMEQCGRAIGQSGVEVQGQIDPASSSLTVISGSIYDSSGFGTMLGIQVENRCVEWIIGTPVRTPNGWGAHFEYPELGCLPDF